jgi:predicted nucleic acid binding AN1-type Zn finger protein
MQRDCNVKLVPALLKDNAYNPKTTIKKLSEQLETILNSS